MIVSVIGVPCVGKGTLVKAVHERMLDQYPVAYITASDIVRKLMTEEDKKAMEGGALFPREAELRKELYNIIEDVSAFGAEIILLDGFPRWDDQMRWMRQTFYDREMQVIQILAPSDFELVRRANLRNRDEYDNGEKLMARVNTQRLAMHGIEMLISSYGIPYTSVINDDQERATLELIERIRWPKPQKKRGK